MDANDIAVETLDPGVFDWLASLSVSEFVRQSDWAYPSLEIIHVLGIALVFAPILIFDLRVLGTYADLSVDRLRRLLLPWVWFGFAMNALSGVLLFMSDAVELASNTAFRAKLMLIVLACINAAIFQTRLDAGRGSPPSVAAKVSAVVSICTWLAIIAAGRLMAYVK